VPAHSGGPGGFFITIASATRHTNRIVSHEEDVGKRHHHTLAVAIAESCLSAMAFASPLPWKRV